MNKRIYKQLLYVVILLISVNAFADTPVTLFQSYAGNLNFVGTAGTRRSESNDIDGTLLIPAATTTYASISGIPAGATIRAAHLYWAGSYSDQEWSTQLVPDYDVIFEGTSITADVNRQYTSQAIMAGYGVVLDFYNGVADVTSIIAARGNPNGSYSFSGLSANNDANHWDTETVLAGWSLVIIYEKATEDLRVVNLYEGFQIFWGNSITLTPTNFKVPTSPINGRISQITWEGDPGNSSPDGGYTEQLVFNGAVLSDASNPVNNQFNSISTIMATLPSTGAVDTNSYGVDFDGYSIDSYLSAGDQSATTTYSSGGDLVILSAEIISITNTPVSDLQITKTHASNFNIGQNGTYTISVHNNGPVNEPGAIVVTDTLPSGLTFVSATGTGWSCSAAGPTVTCSRAGSLAVNHTTANITLTVAISSPASPSVTNTASVSGANFDNISGNDNDSDTVTVTSLPALSLKKTLLTISDPVNGTNNPKSIPGAISEYTLEATNNGAGATDNNSIILSDAIPANTALYVNDISGAGSGPVRFVDGMPASGINYNFVSLSATTDGLSFSNNGGANFNYTPSANADGVDSTVTHVKIATQGSFLASSGAGSPSFKLLFRVKVD